MAQESFLCNRKQQYGRKVVALEMDLIVLGLTQERKRMFHMILKPEGFNGIAT